MVWDVGEANATHFIDYYEVVQKTWSKSGSPNSPIVHFDTTKTTGGSHNVCVSPIVIL